MAHYYLEVPVEEKLGYWTIEFSQGAPNYVGTLVFVETGGGGGETKIVLNYTNLVENLDGTITCFDTNGNSHILVPIYDSNNIMTSITYDGKNVKLVYDSNGNLTNIGDSEVNIHNYPDPEPSGNIGYQVTFKVDDNDYYIASCEVGGAITEPPTPSKSGYTFVAWQLSGDNITFPYTPNADVELTANFATVRTEMEITEAGTVLWTGVTKSNTGKAICGFRKQAGYSYACMMVGLTEADVTSSQTSTQASGTVEYNGVTYYYKQWYGDFENVNPAFVQVSTSNSDTGATLATKILDHYFKND